MSCLWMCLSLLCVTAFLHSSASSSEGVSLDCTRTVEVVAGGSVTLNCSYLENSCKGLRYLWSNTQGELPCNTGSMKHSRLRDNLSYVSLTISDVVVEEEYTLRIETDCATVETSTVNVQPRQLLTTAIPNMYNPGVSLDCNKSVEAVAGGTVTLNCSYLAEHCKVERYLWSNTRGEIPCDTDLMRHDHGWANLTYVSLTISNVAEEDNYTVSVMTDCGTVETSTVEVQVKQQLASMDGVSLNCSTAVEVEAGGPVMLNCTITYNLKEKCYGFYYVWKSPQDEILCNSSKYRCEWDTLSYVSLTISNVTEEASYAVSILTDCGGAESSVIKVQLKMSNITNVFNGSGQPTGPQVIPTTLRMSTLIVLAVLFFLCGTERGREMVRCVKKEKAQGDPSDMDSGPE